MSIPTLNGITAKMIETSRISTRVLFFGDKKGIPVLFLHGNVSSATWWEETMVALPEEFWGIAPDQRGFGEADIEQKIDATDGTGDLAKDAAALMDFLHVEQAHIVGNSLGGMVIWRMLADYPERFLSATLVDTGSPFGFGGTKDLHGTPCFDDFAGSGGGLTNPELAQRIKDNDLSLDSQFSPRAAIRMLLVKPPFIPPREDELVLSLNTSHIGDQDVPGDSTPSPNWPFSAPGKWGATNATSPKYAVDIEQIIKSEPKHRILWIRGADDMVVSDTAASDPGYLGMAGLIPDYPGPEVFPPQPMLGQIRAVLDQYAAAGGKYKEVVIANAGHLPFIEKPEEFNHAFHAHLAASQDK